MGILINNIFVVSKLDYHLKIISLNLNYLEHLRKELLYRPELRVASLALLSFSLGQQSFASLSTFNALSKFSSSPADSSHVLRCVASVRAVSLRSMTPIPTAPPNAQSLTVNSLARADDVEWSTRDQRTVATREPPKKNY